METIEHAGVLFVKATVLAKKHRYTTDYIGQLCRAGKVEAKLIGRAWFVNERSLLEHKSDRYSTTRVSEITIHKSTFSERDSLNVPIRTEVRPVLSNNAHRSVTLQSPPVTYNFQTNGAPRLSTYHVDESQLEPITRTNNDHNVKEITPSNSHKIAISLNEKAVNKLSFEALPEVSLRGNLVIASLDEASLYEDAEPVSVEKIQFTPLNQVPPVVAVTRRYQPRHVQVRAGHQVPAVLPVETPRIVTQSKPVDSMAPEPAGTPLEVSGQRSPVVPEALVKSRHYFLAPTLIFFSVVGTLLMLGLSSLVETDGLKFKESITFNLASVQEALKKFPESY